MNYIRHGNTGTWHLSRKYKRFVSNSKMAPFLLYASLLVISSIASIASPVAARPKRSRDVITAIQIPIPNNSINSVVTGGRINSLQKYLTVIESESSVIKRTKNSTLFTQETSDLLNRETRATRSRSRGRSTKGKSSKRPSSYSYGGKLKTIVNQGRVMTSGHASSSKSLSQTAKGNSGRTVPNPERKSGYSSSLSCDDVEPCGNTPPTKTEVVWKMRNELYRILSSMDMTAPARIEDINIRRLLTILYNRGGDDGKDFVLRANRIHRQMGPLWDQCCQTYVIGRRKRAAVASNKQLGTTKFVTSYLLYDMQR